MRQFVSSLRCRLLVLVLLGLAPLLGWTLHADRALRQRERARWAERCVQAAQLAAREEEELINGIRRLLVMLGQLPQVRSGDAAACHVVLGELLNQNTACKNLGVIKTNGDVWCTAQASDFTAERRSPPGVMLVFRRDRSSPSRSLDLPANVADRQYFQEALLTRDFCIGTFRIDDASRSPALQFGHPVADDAGRVQAVVVATLDPQWLSHFEKAVRVQLPKGATWAMADERGAFLVRSSGWKKWVGRSPVEKTLRQSAREEGRRAVDAVDAAGVPMLCAFTSRSSALFGGKVSVLLAMPKRFVLAEANRTLSRNLTWLGLMTLVGLVICWVGTDLFVLRGVRTLVNSTGRLAGRLLQLQDEERRRIAGELHGNTAQGLAALGMNLSLLNTPGGGSRAMTQKLVNDSLKIVSQCSEEVRTLSYLLHPPVLDALGLVAALEEYGATFAKRHGLRVNLDVPLDLARLPKEVELALFRFLQESLTNVQRHSGSATATIRLVRDAGAISLEVIDTGRGMNVRELQGGRGSGPRKIGVGIAGMRERLRRLGGQVEVDSGRCGTTIRARVPLPTDSIAEDGERAGWEARRLFP